MKEPKEQLEDVAQLFLGVRMQCAQCHHHPFERWSQEDYYALSAFFSQVGRKPSGTRGEDLIFHKRGVATAKHMKTGASVVPAALGDAIPSIAPDEDPRLKLADWMRSPSNPFFAKSLVNRYWKHFFQRGLIEPEDDIRDSNPPTNPELLAALEKQFIESGYDLKGLVRLIVNSTTYQLSSVPNAHNAGDRQNYSRYYPRRMQAETLLDSIDTLTGAKTDFANLPAGTRAISLPDNSYNTSTAFLRCSGVPRGRACANASACSRRASRKAAPHQRVGHQGETGVPGRPCRTARQGHSSRRGTDSRTVRRGVLAPPRDEELLTAKIFSRNFPWTPKASRWTPRGEPWRTIRT